MRLSRWLLMLLSLPLLLLGATLAPALRADATIQYKIEFKPGPMITSSLPQNAVTQQASKPITSIIQLQGEQEYLTTGTIAGMGQTPMLLNFVTKEVTFLDPAGKRYATGRLDDLVAQMNAATASSSSSASTSSLPPAAKMILQQLRLDFSSQKTGSTDAVLGVPVTQSVWTIVLEMPASALPLPGLAPAGGGQVVLAKFVVHAWLANPNDIARNAALTQFSSRGSTMKYLYDPDTLFKSLSDYPALQDSLSSIFKRYMNKPPTVLKLDADMYLPVLAQAIPLLQASGQKLPPNFDPNASLGNISMEMTQLSDAPIDPSVFKVPAGYTSVPLNQVLGGVTKSATPAPGSAFAPRVAPGAAPAVPGSAPGQSASDKAARAAAILRGDQH